MMAAAAVVVVHIELALDGHHELARAQGERLSNVIWLSSDVCWPAATTEQ